MKITNEKDLKNLAQYSLDVSENKASWFAIDKEGNVFAYLSCPIIVKSAWTFWYVRDRATINCWEVGKVDPPDDFTNECYNIRKILKNDN